MFNPTFLFIALPTWIAGLYLLRRMKQIAEKEAKRQPLLIPVKARRENTGK
jgi:hypothetical protein